MRRYWEVPPHFLYSPFTYFMQPILNTAHGINLGGKNASEQGGGATYISDEPWTPAKRICRMNYLQESNPYTARHPVIYPQSALRVLMLFCALFFCLPSTSRRRSEFLFLYIFLFSPNHPILCFSPGKKFFLTWFIFFPGQAYFRTTSPKSWQYQDLEYDVTAIRFGLSLNFEVYIRATAGGGP